MKAAFSTWDNRIAPVFDASNRIRLVEVESGKILRSEQELLPEDLPVQKVLRLAELKTDVLVCGAISRAMHDIIISYGIRVIPFVAGDLDEIVQALASGRSDWTCFSMPGCMAHGRRRSRGAGGKGIYIGSGRNAGSGGDCICPACSHRLRHQRGIPCFEQKCPACGAPMIRG